MLLVRAQVVCGLIKYRQNKQRKKEAVMAADEKIYFGIKDAPGPFRLVAEEVKAYEKHGNRFVLELTVVPMCSGEKLLGHRGEFKLPFEVALHGATTKLGHGANEPRNVRCLGRFLIPRETHPNYINHTTRAPYELNEWQWEAVFNPQSRHGMVFKLDNPIPKEWYL
ncbi:MAG: hypothetical protein Q7S12_00290 [bacterium]|nr:hypothetical protein [bacterium]